MNMLSETMLHPFYSLVHHDVETSRTDQHQLDYFSPIFAEMLGVSEEWVRDNLGALDYYMNADFNITTVQDKREEVRGRRP